MNKGKSYGLMWVVWFIFMMGFMTIAFSKKTPHIWQPVNPPSAWEK